MVVFSVLLMVVVLFFRRGIMGDKEFSWDAIARFFRKLFRRPEPAVAADGVGAIEDSAEELSAKTETEDASEKKEGDSDGK